MQDFKVKNENEQKKFKQDPGAFKIDLWCL